MANMTDWDDPEFDVAKAFRDFIEREMTRPYRPPVYVIGPRTYDWYAEHSEVAIRHWGREFPPRK